MTAPSADAARKLAELESVLRNIGSVAVAVSGGIDSLTLAACAQRALSEGVAMFHAVSPAVPEEATQRTQALAQRGGWNLTILDANEFSRADYVRNPINRCFHCKTSLYSAIRPHTHATIVSGANLDDLGEYRPGLLAASEHAVRHPLVEAAIDKRVVRAIAPLVGLGDLAELPSSPCLSSRVETGIAVAPELLRSIHSAERLVQRTISAKTVRCRVRAQAVVIELDDASLSVLDQSTVGMLTAEVAGLFQTHMPRRLVRFEPYRLGSAFLHQIKVVS